MDLPESEPILLNATDGATVQLRGRAERIRLGHEYRIRMSRQDDDGKQ